MDRIVVVLFAYKRLDQTKRQVEDLLRLGYTSIYVFQDFCHEIQPLIFIHHNVTVVARNHNYGQFLNYHSAFIHLQNIYDIALVLEDDFIFLPNFEKSISDLLKCSYDWELVRLLSKPKLDNRMKKNVASLSKNYKLVTI